jgi:hypothetical protein
MGKENHLCSELFPPPCVHGWDYLPINNFRCTCLELRAMCLLGNCSTSWATHPAMQLVILMPCCFLVLPPIGSRRRKMKFILSCFASGRKGRALLPPPAHQWSRHSVSLLSLTVLATSHLRNGSWANKCSQLTLFSHSSEGQKLEPAGHNHSAVRAELPPGAEGGICCLALVASAGCWTPWFGHVSPIFKASTSKSLFILSSSHLLCVVTSLPASSYKEYKWCL